MIHYHGTPITPNTAALEMAGRCFCVSHARPDQVELAHKIGQSVMLDNGAFSVWKRGYQADWKSYYRFCDKWLDYRTTWAVIPDEIEGDESAQNDLLKQWPFGDRGAPVWHMHESIDRILDLIDDFTMVCIGSSAEYAVVLSPIWQRRMDEVWNVISKTHARTPWIHMLRGMQLIRHRWPFASVDSTDIARNHNGKKSPRKMADRWDAGQCPAKYLGINEQMEIELC